MGISGGTLQTKGFSHGDRYFDDARADGAEAFNATGLHDLQPSEVHDAIRSQV